MSLLEGFSDYVMDEVGRDLVPDVERISARFHERRQRSESPFERAIMRLTGHGREDGAVPEGRAVRPGDRRRAAALPRSTACGTARRRCRATARSTIRRPGSPRVRRRGDRVSAPSEPTAGRAGSGQRAGRRPAAIALTPILSARYRAQRSRADPGGRARRADRHAVRRGPGRRAGRRRRGAAPRLAVGRRVRPAPRPRAAPGWVHSASAGVERALTPAARERGLVITNARGVFSRPIAEYVLMMILAVSRRLPQLLELQRERTWQPLEGARAARHHGRHRRSRLDRTGRRGARDRVRLPRHRDAPTAGDAPIRGRRRTTSRVVRRGDAGSRLAARRRCRSSSPSRTSSSWRRR